MSSIISRCVSFDPSFTVAAVAPPIPEAPTPCPGKPQHVRHMHNGLLVSRHLKTSSPPLSDLPFSPPCIQRMENNQCIHFLHHRGSRRRHPALEAASKWPVKHSGHCGASPLFFSARLDAAEKTTGTSTKTNDLPLTYQSWSQSCCHLSLMSSTLKE